MKLADIISKVKSLNLPDGSYIVFGSGPLAAAGLREVSDIDMVVTPELLEAKRREGWKELDKGGNDKPLTYDVFEIHNHWQFGKDYNPKLADLLDGATYIDGVPFVALEEVRRWKSSLSRPKDIKDIELIDGYLKSKK